MPLYVYAIVDAPPARPPGRGLTAPLTLQRVAGAFAIVERRADVPPLELGALAAHHRIVQRLARSVHAILPVRFGTLMTAADLRDALEGRDEELAEALDEVRDRVQFTWRVPLQNARRGSTRVGRGAHPAQTGMISGAEYLRRAARSGSDVAPPLRPVRRALAAFVVSEKSEQGTPTRGAALYHLVSKKQAAPYRRAAELLDAPPQVAMTGPLPPFAFAPELL